MKVTSPFLNHPQRVAWACCVLLGIAPETLQKNRCRRRWWVNARTLTAGAILSLCHKQSLQDVADATGIGHHTTVMYHRQRYGEFPENERESWERAVRAVLERAPVETDGLPIKRYTPAAERRASRAKPKPVKRDGFDMMAHYTGNTAIR